MSWKPCSLPMDLKEPLESHTTFKPVAIAPALALEPATKAAVESARVVVQNNHKNPSATTSVSPQRDADVANSDTI